MPAEVSVVRYQTVCSGRFAGYFAPFADKAVHRRSEPVYSKLPVTKTTNGEEQPVLATRRRCRFRKSFPPRSLLCLYKCRNSGKHGEAISVRCIADKPTWKAVLRSRVLFGYCVSFWNVSLLDLAWSIILFYKLIFHSKFFQHGQTIINSIRTAVA